MTGMRLVGTSAAEAVIKPLAFWPEAQSCPASSEAELVWHSRSLYITRTDFHFWSTVSEELQKLQIGFVVTYVQGHERTSVTSCLAPCCWQVCQGVRAGLAADYQASVSIPISSVFSVGIAEVCTGMRDIFLLLSTTAVAFQKLLAHCPAGSPRSQ